jgi:hypothetical protein
MAKTRRSLVAAFSFLVGSAAVIAPPALAGEEGNRTAPAYTLASLSGDYAVVGSYGANVARLIGTYHADGKGFIEGQAVVNQPGAGTARIVVPITFSGPYTIEEDGTGVINFTVVLPNGGTAPATLDLLITKAKVIGRSKVATEIATAQRESSSVVNGQFVTHLSTRRPDTKGW